MKFIVFMLKVYFYTFKKIYLEDNFGWSYVFFSLAEIQLSLLT